MEGDAPGAAAVGPQNRFGDQARDVAHVVGHYLAVGEGVVAHPLLGAVAPLSIELLEAGERGRLVVMKGRTVTHIPLEEAEGKQRLVPLDHPLIRAARNVNTCFG